MMTKNEIYDILMDVLKSKALCEMLYYVKVKAWDVNTKYGEQAAYEKALRIEVEKANPAVKYAGFSKKPFGIACVIDGTTYIIKVETRRGIVGLVAKY